MRRRAGGCGCWGWGGADSVTDKSGLEAGDERKIRDRREEESRNTGQDVGGGVEQEEN